MTDSTAATRTSVPVFADEGEEALALALEEHLERPVRFHEGRLPCRESEAIVSRARDRAGPLTPGEEGLVTPSSFGRHFGGCHTQARSLDELQERVVEAIDSASRWKASQSGRGRYDRSHRARPGEGKRLPGGAKVAKISEKRARA